MDLRQLRYFVQIAESGSLRKAAARLRIAQPSLSRHIKKLEDEFGIALFERHARGVSVTNAGNRLLARSRRILRDADDMRSELVERGDQPAGRISFGTSGAISRLLYGRLAERLQSEYPGIEPNFVEGNAYILLEGIETRKIDLALMGRAEPRSDIVLEPLVDDPLYLVGAAGDPALDFAKVNVSEMENFPLVIFRRPSGPRMILEQEAQRTRSRLTVAFEVDSIDVIKNFVFRGLGYGVMSHSSICEEMAAGKFRAAEINGVRLTRMLVRRADTSTSPVMDQFAEIVRQEIEALRKQGIFG